ncbi:MAG TPA: hypothetical protein VFD75_00975 [Pyrinomonadaceae bacterium]|nr:hypothetical protein [Pyrinomonadaceae bacterium]
MDKPNPQPHDKQDKQDTAHVQTVPIIVDLGSRRKKLVQDLKDGRGKLLVEVELAVEQARAALPESEKNKTLVPVVVLYRQKRRKRRAYDDFVPFNPLNPLSFFRC